MKQSTCWQWIRPCVSDRCRAEKSAYQEEEDRQRKIRNEEPSARPQMKASVRDGSMASVPAVRRRMWLNQGT